MTRLQAAEQLRKALQIFASTLTETQALEIATVYPAWEANRAYSAGDIISFGVNSVGDPQLYKVAQAHTSQEQYKPGAGTESLYTAFGINESGVPVWAQPSGAHDAYKVDDVVDYGGKLYKSLIDGNVWSPDVYPAGWELVESGEPEPEPEPGGEGEDEPSTDYPEWVQPTGAHDAYNTGDIVRYNGQLYKSLIDANTYSPDAYPAGWEVYTEPKT